MIAKNRKIKKGGTYQSIISSILIGIFLVAVVGFLVVSNLKINQKRAESMAKIEELKKEIQDLSKRNEELKAGIIRTEDDDYWKGRLYEQGYVEPGEQAVVIVPPSDEKKEETETPKGKGFLETIKEILGF